MTTEKSGIVLVVLKNGCCFEHNHPLEPESKLIDLYQSLCKAILSQKKQSILRLPNPSSVYRVEDIAGVQFPKHSGITDTPPIGFHAPEK